MLISALKANLVALVVECCLFGIFTTLFFLTLWILFKKSSTGRTNRPLVLTVCLMYILAIAHLCIDVYRAINAFVNYADVPGGPIVFYAKLNHPTQVARSAVYSAQALLADGFFVWRCYIVWDKRWSIIILSVIMLVGGTITAVGAVVAVGARWGGSRADVVITPQLDSWVESAFSMTLAINIVCTVLLVVRIWRSQRRLKTFGHHSALFPVMIVVIESAGIYSSALIATIATYTARSNLQFIALDPLTSLVGIVFTFIIIRVGLGISLNGSSPPQSPQPVTHTLPNTSATTRYLGERGDYSVKPMRFPFSVDVVNHSDADSLYQASTSV